MTQRNLLLFSFPLLLVLILTVTWLVIHYQGERFEETYLAELRQETEKRFEQMILFFQPLLEKNDLETLDRYCDTLTKQRQSIVIFDRRGAPVIASEKADLRCYFTAPDIAEALRIGRYVSVQRDSQTGVWTACATAVIHVRSKPLVIRLVNPDPEIDTILNKLESSFAFFFIAPFALGYLIWYLVRRVARPLDQLQHSAERIAAGDLNVNVTVPQKGAVRDLALSMSAMSDRLKKEVETVRRQEIFRRDFIANVSHAIKTPLTGILSAIQMLDEGGWNNPLYLTKCREVLTRQTHILQSLVRDVLLLAELERMEENDTDFTPVALDELLRRQIRLCAETFNRKEADFHLIQCDTVVVSAPYRLVEQALSNLLSNAVKYGNDSIIDISLNVKNKNAIVTVRDYGPGIPEEYSEQIFDRFFRLRSEYGRRPEGTGLGLAIVRQISALLGGSIRLEAADGPGAQFVLTLPIASEIHRENSEEQGLSC